MITGKTSEGRHLRDQQLVRDPQHTDIAYKTLFVFDEAHNLISKGLPEEQRKDLEEEFTSVTISGTNFKTTRDIYGNINGIDRKIQGRDLIAAMLYQSYELS